MFTLLLFLVVLHQFWWLDAEWTICLHVVRSSVSRSSSSSGRFVVSKMSLIQILAGLPLGRLPSIQPCMMVFSKQSPGRRMICPKYRNLRSVTDFSSWRSTPSSCNTLSFVLLAVHGTRNRRRYFFSSNASILCRSAFHNVQLFFIGEQITFSPRRHFTGIKSPGGFFHGKCSPGATFPGALL